MRSATAVVAAATVLALAGGCTSSEDMTLLHREITDVQRQVQQLETSTLDKGDLRQMEDRMQQLTSQTMRSNADLSQRVERLQEQIEALDARLELTVTQLESISQELAATRSRLTGRTSLPPVTTMEPGTEDARGEETPPRIPGDEPEAGTPEQVYRSAYEDYMRGNYQLAAEGFREYMRRWPDTELTDNALYWIGEALDAQDETEEALEVFSEVLDRFPTSDKAAAAQLKKALLYLKMGDQGQGVVHLQYVVYEHPGTREADLARERLRSLGVTIR